MLQFLLLPLFTFGLAVESIKELRGVSFTQHKNPTFYYNFSFSSGSIIKHKTPTFKNYNVPLPPLSPYNKHHLFKILDGILHFIKYFLDTLEKTM